MTKTATLIQDNLPDFNGHAALYRCEPPLQDYDENKHEYVVVSAVHDSCIYETYIFPSDITGAVTDWLELPGSMKNTVSHEYVLTNLDYIVKH